MISSNVTFNDAEYRIKSCAKDLSNSTYEGYSKEQFLNNIYHYTHAGFSLLEVEMCGGEFWHKVS